MTEPGPPPRSITWGDLLSALPTPLKIGLLVNTLFVTGAVWYAITGGPRGWPAASFFGVILLGALIWAGVIRNKLVTYVAAKAKVFRLGHPQNFQTSHLLIIYYSFEVDGKPYRGEHTVSGGYSVDDELYVLYKPTNPRDSIPWNPGS